MTKALVCLCIIVKNDNLYIRKCIQSYLPSIDMIAVIDRGSTDGTIDTIKMIMEEQKIPGGIKTKHWKSIVTLRNNNVEYAYSLIRCYHGIHPTGPITKEEANKINPQWKLLFTDTNNIILNEGEKVNDPVNIKDYISENIDHYDIPIIKDGQRFLYRAVVSLNVIGSKGFKFYGEVNEYVSTIDWIPRVLVIKGIYIHSDSASYSLKKTIKNATKLLNCLEHNKLIPADKDRYTFYAAQSFLQAAKKSKEVNSPYHNIAYNLYKKRAEMITGSNEERYFSYLKCAYLLPRLSNMGELSTPDRIQSLRIEYLLKANNICSERREALRDLMDYYDSIGLQKSAWALVKDLVKNNDYDRYTLFVDTSQYGYSFDEKAALVAYYGGDYEAFRIYVERALSDPKIPNHQKMRIEKHRSFYR